MQKAERNLSLIVISGILLIVVIFVLAPPSLPATQSQKLTVTTLDIGQGDSIFIRTPDDITILIDGGRDKVAADAFFANEKTKIKTKRVIKFLIFNKAIFSLSNKKVSDY
jgi:beta-lactamase superfamily II metal-dependent hydrolase